MSTKKTVIYLLLVLLGQFAISQNLTIKNYTTAWDNMTEMVLETAKKMPAEAYLYRPNKDVRSFGEQMNHFSRSNIGLGSMVFGTMPIFKFDSRNPPVEKAAIIDLLEKSFVYFKDNLAKMNKKDLEEIVSWGRPGSGMEVSKHKGLLMIFSHFQLEYGKTTIYARANDIVPHPSAGWKF